MSEPQYKWSHPAEWLIERIQNDTASRVREYAVALLGMVDADQIQDVFQSEMDSDGYFTQLESQDNREAQS